jgi:hypothetical protein
MDSHTKKETNMIKTLCTKFIERSQALGLKGKKRDDAALHFFVGAAHALLLVNPKSEDAQRVKRWLELILQMRGYEAVEAEVTK